MTTQIDHPKPRLSCWIGRLMALAVLVPLSSFAGNDDVSTGTLPVGTTEQTVIVGAQDWPLPGVLTLPASADPFVAVVLVHGSGPHDADETVFGNKPFRDLAHGLAARGIATLRYVKRSKEHGSRMKAQTPDITAAEEVIDDAVAAVDWLRTHDRIDRDRVFVLGHSLGAMLAPRIAHAAPASAGLIVMAGPSRPLEDLVMEQLRYLGPKHGVTEQQIGEFQTQTDRVKALARGESVDGPLLLGLPASYWRDLSAYDPVATALAIPQPMLILQGERDYQVTLRDFQGWRRLESERGQAKLLSYPTLNHLFIAGEGPSLPSEYLRPGRVDAQVIADIADWIKSVQPTRSAP